MTGFVWPTDPTFASAAEKKVFDMLVSRLGPRDALLYGLRIKDGGGADVEIDFALFVENLGLAIIESKGGYVRYSNGSWQTSGSKGTFTVDPPQQARRGQYALRSLIQDSPTWSRGLLNDCAFVVLPETDITESTALSADISRDQLIGRQELAETFDLVCETLSCRPLVSASGWVSSAIDIVLQRGDQQRDVIRQARDRADFVNRITEDQEIVLDMLAENQYIEVKGSAGTGKTWLACEQARRWSAEGKRVALLSFGRGLAETINAQFSATKRQHRPAFIGTYHQLGSQWSVRAPADADSDWWNIQAPDLMRQAAEELEPGKKFDALVIDEAQDFATNWWPALMAGLKDPQTANIATFRDDRQDVFSRGSRPDVPFAVATLPRNLRNTKQIAHEFGALIDSFTPVVGIDGPPVSFVPCALDDVISTADDEAVALLDAGWNTSDVALLTTSSRHPVQREMQEQEVGGYWPQLWDGDDIFYATVAGFKGLERPAVVVAINGFREDLDPREVLYVAMSRARDQLVIVGDPNELERAGIRVTASGQLRVAHG